MRVETPMEGGLTSEEKRRLQAQIPRGDVYPGMFRKGQAPRRTDRSARPMASASGSTKSIEQASVAKAIIGSVPEPSAAGVKRQFWEHKLLGLYYHFYGKEWQEWPRLLPWLSSDAVEQRARLYGCERKWDWIDKRHFLGSRGYRWDLKQFDYLVDRYPQWQRDEHSQGIFVKGKSFEEIQQLACDLMLPTADSLATMGEYATKF